MGLCVRAGSQDKGGELDLVGRVEPGRAVAPSRRSPGKAMVIR